MMTYDQYITSISVSGTDILNDPDFGKYFKKSRYGDYIIVDKLYIRKICKYIRHIPKSRIALAEWEIYEYILFDLTINKIKKWKKMK